MIKIVDLVELNQAINKAISVIKVNKVLTNTAISVEKIKTQIRLLR
jgi:hypothetical protein